MTKCMFTQSSKHEILSHSLPHSLKRERERGERESMCLNSSSMEFNSYANEMERKYNIDTKICY